MNKLIVLTAMFGLTGCDDRQMNLGPDGRGIPIGSNNSAGQTTTGTGGAGARGGTSGLGGFTEIGGSSGTPASAGTAAIGGSTSFHGLSLEGLQRFSVTAEGGMMENPPGPCNGAEPRIYTLDMATKTLTFEHCGTAVDGTTTARVQESRILTDAEIVAAMQHLRLISTDYEPTCGMDKPIETLELGFGDHTAKYQDDFYSNCGADTPRNVSFVHNMDQLISFLIGSVIWPEIPSEYDGLTLQVLAPTSVNVDWMDEACRTKSNEIYEVDFSAGTIKFVSCGYLATENRVGPAEKSRALTASEIASLKARIAELRLGAVEDCSQELGVPDLALTSGGNYVASFAGEHAACPWSPVWSSVSVLNLEALHTALMYLINPPV